MSAVLGRPRRPRWVWRTLRRVLWPAEITLLFVICLVAVEMLQLLIEVLS